MATAIRYSARELARLEAENDHFSIESILDQDITTIHGRPPSFVKCSFVDRGLAALTQDLVAADRGDIELMIDYQLPHTSKRADVVLAGIDPRTGGDVFIVIELKNWQHAARWNGDDRRSLVQRSSDNPVLHPALQAKGYADYIRDFTTSLHGARDKIEAAVYLFKADHDNIEEILEATHGSEVPIFSRSSRHEFVEYLREQFSDVPGAAAADRLLFNMTRPPKKLMEHARSEIVGEGQFTLLANQRLAYEAVRSAVDRTEKADLKTVIVITGGPGSGKSLLGLALLGELSRAHYSVLHATGSRAFTQTMRRYAARGSGRAKAMFKYFNNFMEAGKNELDVLICDEAHRIRETSANRYTSARLRTGRPQIDELFDVARVPIFLFDEHQAVRPGEIGTLDLIQRRAQVKNLAVVHVSLDEQFRHGGDRLYEDWVSRLLGLQEGAPGRWEGDGHFDLIAVTSPEELEAHLKKHQAAGLTARMTAGFCWPWSDPVKSETGRPEFLVADIVIGSWARPWNVKGDRAVGDAPPSELWATDEGGAGQVGCVYTAQGFEYDWNGVIIGPDLLYRDGRLVTDRKASRDPALRSKTVTDEQADRLIRSTYKVLLTRGMVGTVLYSTDPETQAYLATLVTRD